LRDILNGLHEGSKAGQLPGRDAAQHAGFESLDHAGDLLSCLAAGRRDGYSKGPAVIGIEGPSGQTRRFQTIQHAGESGRAMSEDPQELPDRTGAVGDQVGQKMSFYPVQAEGRDLGGEVHVDLPAGFVERGKNLKRHGASSI